MENQNPEIQMETLSAVVIDPLNPPPPSYNESTELVHWEESDDIEAHGQKARENSESRKLAHGKEPVVEEEAHEEEDYAAPIYFEKPVLDPTWMTSMGKKLVAQPKILKVSSSKFSTSIHRVPPNLCRQDKNAYVPLVISIGPLHYHKRRGKLRAMEEHKWRYLNDIISRKGKVWFEQCLVAVQQLEKQARDCYSEVIQLNSNSFVEMMVLDGCFLIHFFCERRSRQDVDDPIFELMWLKRELVIDLVMLENQIPFFILQTLFDLMDIPHHSLKVAAFNFFRRWPFYRNILPKIECTRSSNLPIHHLLHLLHENIVFSIDEKYPLPIVPDSSEAIQCASKLLESGIKFKRRDDINGAGNFLDINFEKGIIEIPGILVEDKTNTMFRNLIAFEQCYLHCKKYITAYTFFMDCLINNSKDVEILVQKGIIKNQLGTEEDVALLFNNINKEVIFFTNSLYLSVVSKEINHYCGTAWPRLRATLMHDYFKTPWAVISFIAALFLLLFTMTQTFFSGFPKFAAGN